MNKVIILYCTIAISLIILSIKLGYDLGVTAANIACQDKLDQCVYYEMNK